MTELWIDGLRIELEPTTVRQTFQSNTLGNPADRQLNYTNKFKIPHTDANSAFFRRIKELNSLTEKPYRYLPAVIASEGFEVAVGTAKVEGHTPKDISVSVQSGGEGLFNAINGLTLRDLDWSALDHTLTYAIVTGSQDGSQPYIYAHRESVTGLVNQQNNVDYWLPSVYEHHIWDMIFTQFGYTYSGDIFAEDEFLDKVVNPVTFDEDEANILARNFATFMPEISLTDFIRDIMVRYGLDFRQTPYTANYEFYTIESIFSGITEAEDWSAAYAETKEVKHVLGKYARRNYFRAKDRDAYNGSADGFFELDVDHLPQSVDVYVSPYAAYYQLTPFETIQMTIFEVTGTLEYNVQELEPSLSEIEEINYSGQYTSDVLGVGPTYSGPTPFLRFNNLNWSKFTFERYNALKQIANRAKVVTAEMYLSQAQISRLNFTKLKWVKQLSSYFYVDRISNWTPGKVCEVVMTRVPPNVFSQAELVNTAPVVNLEVSASPVNQGTEMNFIINVTDAENNIERWELDTGIGLPLSGFGPPPATLPYTYNAPGPYTATLTVFDFGGLQGSDTADIVINDTYVVTLDAANGEYVAPPGSQVTVNCSIGGQFDTSSALIAVGTVQTSNPPDAGHSDLGSRTIFRDPNDGPSTDQFVFIMPASGVAYVKAYYYVGSGGPTIFGYASGQLNNNGEVHTATVTNSNQIYP